MTVPPDDRHPVDRPRRGARLAALLRQLAAAPELVITCGGHLRPCLTAELAAYLADVDAYRAWLSRRLPGQVVIVDPELAYGVIAATPPELLPARLLPAAMAARHALTSTDRRGPIVSSHPTEPEPTQPAPARPPHACPCTCGVQVPHALYCCRPGWRALPGTLKRAITDARPGTAEHRAAMGLASAWFRGRASARRPRARDDG